MCARFLSSLSLLVTYVSVLGGGGQQTPRQQAAEDGARKLEHDIDQALDELDLAQQQLRERDRRVEVRARQVAKRRRHGRHSRQLHERVADDAALGFEADRARGLAAELSAHAHAHTRPESNGTFRFFVLATLRRKTPTWKMTNEMKNVPSSSAKYTASHCERRASCRPSKARAQVGAAAQTCLPVFGPSLACTTERCADAAENTRRPITATR